MKVFLFSASFIDLLLFAFVWPPKPHRRPRAQAKSAARDPSDDQCLRTLQDRDRPVVQRLAALALAYHSRGYRRLPRCPASATALIQLAIKMAKKNPDQSSRSGGGPPF